MGKLLSVLEEGGPWARVPSVLSDLSPSYLGFHKSPGVNERGARLRPSPGPPGVPRAELRCELCDSVPMAPAPPIPSASPAGHGLGPPISGCAEARAPLARCRAGRREWERVPQPRSRLPHVRAPRCAR